MSHNPIDVDDLDRLVREHLPAAMRFATRLTGHPSVAEDVVQEALYRVARSWRTYRGEARFRTWFFQIIINAHRDRPVRPIGAKLDSETPDPQQSDPAERLMHGELQSEVAACVSRLPERQREVMVLTVYEELSVEEVATLLGITEQNVHATLHIARRRLRDELSESLIEKS